MRHRPEFALSLKQPFAELIMRGMKTDEFRRSRTHKRGRIWIYAALGRWPAEEEARWAEEYGLDVESLPRGVLVGTVELCGCEKSPNSNGFVWKLRVAERSDLGPIRPEMHPMPVWFRPFNA